MMLAKLGTLFQRFAARLLVVTDWLAYRKFYNYPFGRARLATANRYREIGAVARAKQYPVIDEYENKKGHAIDPDWMHGLAQLTQVTVKKSDICYQHGRLLYSVLSEYLAGHAGGTLNIVETGTARGFSSLCMAKALSDSGKPGKIITFDVLPHDVPMYWNCIADAQGPVSRAQLLKDYDPLVGEHIIFIQGDSRSQLKKVQANRVHLAFLDGQHTYASVMDEFECIRGKQESGDIVFFDDYTPGVYPGIVKAVDEICGKHGYAKETIALSEQRGYAIGVKN